MAKVYKIDHMREAVRNYNWQQVCEERNKAIAEHRAKVVRNAVCNPLVVVILSCMAFLLVWGQVLSWMGHGG